MHHGHCTYYLNSRLSSRNGQFSTSLYDGVFNGIAEYIDMYETLSAKEINDRIEVLKNDDEFKKASGVASNYKERVKKRITRALEIFA